LCFDRLLAGELDAAREQHLAEHVRGCARCAPLLAELRRGRDAFSQVVPEAILQRVQEHATPRRVLRAWTTPMLAAASLVLAYVAWPKQSQETPSVRTKGGVQLAFYVLHEGAVRPGADGEHVQPGDRIEFRYTSARDAFLAIVSIDAARKASVYYAESDRAAEIPAASRAVLDRSTLLDDTLGQELVYALACSRPIPLAPVLQALERAPDQPPTVAGCSVERITLLKVAR
jgi:hypothetical protein